MINPIIYGLHLSTDPKIRYIGYTTKSANVRLKQHRRDATNGSHHIKHKWMRKHGVENISIRVLEVCPFGDYDYLSYAERYWIASMTSFGHNLYNQTPGGLGGRGSTHTEQTRAKMRASHHRLSGPEHHMYGRKQSPETIARRVAKFTKTRWTPEAREKQRQLWLTDHPLKDVDRSGANNSFYGKNHSEDTRARMSKAAKNRPPISDETRRKMSESRKGLNTWTKGRPAHNKGVPMSEEQKRKISESKAGKPNQACHVRWHVNRDTVNPDCPFCVPTTKGTP